MRIRINTELSLPWDDSSDSFYTNDSDNEEGSTTTQPSATEPNHLHITNQPGPTNPYRAAPQPPPPPTILNTLRSWILPNNNNPAPPPTPNQPTIPNQIEVPAVVNPAPQSTTTSNPYQTALTRATTNHHWGDEMILPKPMHTFRVLSRNVNTLSTQQHYIQWKAASQAMSDCEADAIALQETNVPWNRIHKQNVRKILMKPTGHTLIATSSSAEINTQTHQRGGTLQGLVGSWVSRAVSTGKDNTGLGRWSYIELQGCDSKRYIILSGYRVCENQQIDMGSNNTFNQQYRLLHQQGHQNPDPRSQFLDDLIGQVKIWRDQQKAVLICIDANENPQQPSDQGIFRLFQETDLLDLHTYRQPNQTRPPTYNRGSTPIDLCAGSIEFAEALQAAWYLPFGLPIGLKGDHRTLGLDFNSDVLFHQRIAAPYQAPTRGVYSNNIKLVEKFCKQVITECQDSGLYGRIHQMATKQTLHQTDKVELDGIDAELTRILVKADQKCVKAGNAPWSPPLHEAYLIHHYWSLKLSHKRTKRNYPQAFQAIEARVHPSKLHPAHLTTISANLRAAQNLLREHHKTAQEKRQKHLDELITAADTCNDKRKKKLILCLKRAEELRHCYAMVRSITKPRQPGGISHVKIPTHAGPDEAQWESIYDPTQIEQLVLQQHRAHFSQAKGTVFTTAPLRDLIDDECTSEYAQQILQGTAAIDNLPVDEYTKALLVNLKTKVEPGERTTTPLDTDEIIKGFKLWPERTSTSPSGRHLGIYKSLAKHFPPPKDPATPDTSPEPPDPLQSGNDILKLIIMMMDLAVTHTHTYDRWKTIWTLLLEKDVGDPKIDRLRTIHLYEADYNLLLKWFSSKGFIIRSEQAHRITDSQGGGRSGRSAIDLAITKVLSYEVADILRMRVIIVDNDATACFDRMIEAPNNLACLQHGADPRYIKLHAQTQRELHYHLKHKYGISTEFNSHTTAQPWYGMGQGAGDACNRWVIGSDSMANAYTSEAHGWTIPSPIPTENTNQDLKAFIDDVNLFIGQPDNKTENEFLAMAQADINRWHGILRATGGELNTKKCFWSDFNLQFDTKGNPSIREKRPEDPQLHLTNTEGTEVILKFTLPNEGIRHLGVYISMDGNSLAETKVLFQRCKMFQKVFTQCPITRKEAAVIYSTIYLPTITYPFPATTLPLPIMEKAQSMTTPMILSKMGYNKNMPKAVVYAPSTHGGLGLKHLHTEQGLQKVIQVLKHLRTATTLGKLMDITIKAYQIQAGISNHILEDTAPLSWMPNRWINNLREFLHSINGTIQVEHPWTIPPLRTNDQHLMETFLRSNLPAKDLQTLNNCRLYLQVTTLSEISDHTGTKILDAVFISGQRTPSLTHISKSLFQWPTQPNPGKPAWKLWTRTIQALYTKPGMATQLKQQLGPWYHSAATVRKWYTTFHPTTQAIITSLPGQQSQTLHPTRTNRTHVYYQQGTPTQLPNTNYPITTELQRQGCRIAFPIHPIPTYALPAPEPPLPTLELQIRKLLPTYAPELWSNFSPAPATTHTDLDDLLRNARGNLIIVSDASLNTHQRSAFSWTISSSTTELWIGAGTSPSTQRDAHSGRSEGYGLLSAFLFLEKYIQATGLHPPARPKQVIGYCDNSGLIQQVSSLQNAKIPNPSITISNDYDLSNEIYRTICRIPFPIKLLHVKGHQDNNTPVEDLPYEAQLNIACDDRARQNLALLPINLAPHPSLPSAFPHLRIKNQTIVRQVSSYLQESARLPEYYKYLTQKFNWPPNTTDQIEWRTLELTLRRFRPPDKIRIRKIIHEWIPTKVSPGNSPSVESDRLCPSCKRDTETPVHLLTCDHPVRRQLRTVLQHKLLTIFTSHNIDPHVYQMWWLGMITATNPTEHPIDMYPRAFHPIYRSQTQIGWKQLYYGRLSKQWTQYLYQNHPDLDPTKFFATITQHVWTYVLELWTTRNNDNALATAMIPQNMMSEIQGIYAARDRLPQHAQDRIFILTKEELINKPKQYIQNWITHSKTFIRNELKILAKQQRANTQDIRQFFQPR